jgi:hypothetical protein
MGSEGADFPLREDLLGHYEIAHNDLGVQYIRFHGIFHDNLKAYSEDEQGNPRFNFEMIDKLYDNLLDIGIRPFVELSFMPEQLTSKDTYIFHWKGNTSPPKDYKKWEALVKGFVEHCVKRYGRKEVRKWYFEVWNEPNIVFWSGTQEKYWELYKHSAKAIKEVDPWLKVGGPATAGGEWVKELDLRLDDKQTFYYSIYPHKGDWQEAGVLDIAKSYSEPFLGFQVQENSNYILPSEVSLFTFQLVNIIPTSIQRTEEGLRCRFYETFGEPTKLQLKFAEGWQVNQIIPLKEVLPLQICEIDIKKIK